MNITVADVTNLYGWQFKLYFLNTILNCTNIAEGPFLNSAGFTFPIFDIQNNFNTTHGRVLAACTLTGAGVSANGTGVVATLTFNATTLGDSPIVLQETKLVDNESPTQPIPHVPVGGDVTVVIPPVQVVDVYTQRGGVGGNVSSDPLLQEKQYSSTLP